MAAPASGHWTFGIIVGYGLGLGKIQPQPLSDDNPESPVPRRWSRVAIKTLAATATPVLPTTVTADVALAATATFDAAPATTATFEVVAPATAATFEVAPATATLEAAISTNSVVGSVEEGSGGAIVIAGVAQSTSSSAASTVLSI
eukprot:scaffold421376_cov52-Attheya_sp.AAC.1